MPLARLKEHLDEHGVKYVTISHSRAYTAQEVAASAHISGKDLAKTVMVKLDGDMAMAVVPASHRVDLAKLAAASGHERAELAREADFKELFPNCEVGAMPPFGNLWQLPVYASHSLAEDEEIAFSAGSHTELVKLAFADFERLVQPQVAAFSERP